LAGGGSSSLRKPASADSRAKSDTLKRKAVSHNHPQALSSSSAAAKSETLKRKTDGHQIFGTAEFNSRNRKSAAAAGESTATLRRKSEDRGSGKVRSSGGGGGIVSAADELSEYLLRQSVDSSSYGLFSRKSADKSDTFMTVHFSEIPRPKLLSTGTLT